MFWNFKFSLTLANSKLKISSPFWQWKTDFDYFKMPQKPRLSKNYSLMNRRKIRKTEPLLPVQVLRWMDRRSAMESAARGAVWWRNIDVERRISTKRSIPETVDPSTNHSVTIERKFICFKNTKKVLSFWAVLHLNFIWNSFFLKFWSVPYSDTRNKANLKIKNRLLWHLWTQKTDER